VSVHAKESSQETISTRCVCVILYRKISKQVIGIVNSVQSCKLFRISWSTWWSAEAISWYNVGWDKRTVKASNFTPRGFFGSSPIQNVLLTSKLCCPRKNIKFLCLQKSKGEWDFEKNFRSTNLVSFVLMANFTDSCYESCKDIWKVSMRWKVGGFYGILS
jgi:hypothetical protein